MEKKSETYHTFWIENKVANEQEVPESQIIERFERWLVLKGRDWVEHYDSQTTVTCFIADKKGMNASFKFSTVGSLVTLLKPYIKAYLQ